MTSSGETRPRAKRYLEIVCTCGRTLRAGLESVGSTVQCWQCHASVPVPVPKEPALTAGVLRWGLRDVFTVRSMASVVAGVVFVIGVLSLHIPGLAQAVLILGLVSLGYGVLIRRNSWAPGGVAAAIGRVVATLGVSLLPMIPWLVLRDAGGLDRPPRLFGPVLGVAAAFTVLVPLLMMILWGTRRPSQGMRAAWHRPFATITALAVVPIGLVAAEGVAFGLTNVCGMFSYYVVDLYPDPERVAPQYGIPLAGNYHFPVVPDDRHMKLYRHWLDRGMPLSAALPSSLGVPHTPGDFAWAIDMTDSHYWWNRTLHSAAIAVVWLTALVLQAYWLGLIARLERRYERE